MLKYGQGEPDLLTDLGLGGTWEVQPAELQQGIRTMECRQSMITAMQRKTHNNLHNPDIQPSCPKPKLFRTIFWTESTGTFHQFL